MSALWLLLMCFSLWRESTTLNIICAVTSLIIGCVVLVLDPRTTESQRVGYKPIGIVMIIVGVIGVILEIYHKVILPQIS